MNIESCTLKEVVMDKRKYISNRVVIAFIVNNIIILLMLCVLWFFSIKYPSMRLIAGVFSIVIVLFSISVYKYIVLPIKESLRIYEQFILGYVMNDLLEIRYPFSYQSEMVIKRFWDMVDKDKLISISKKEAEYLALQNQINPHFLYNTLEGIRSEAIIAGLDSIAEMTEALATFFRYTISHMDNLVTLEDELENIENYFYIQQFRFGDRLVLSIEYENEELDNLDILSYCLPKLTLQPIVENSIYHGIERKIGRGHLIIKIRVSDERLMIRVSDDGIGMDEKILHDINESLRTLSIDDMGKKPRRKGGIALMNVNNRIKLLFGEEYGIYVYSNIGSGTDVEISLPLVTK